MLLWSECVDFTAPESKFTASDVLIDFERDVVYHAAWLTRNLLLVLNEILGAESLDSERHIHNLCRMTVTSCKGAGVKETILVTA